MEFLERFDYWCKENLLDVKHIDELIYQIVGVEGNIMLLKPSEKILDENCWFNLEIPEFNLIEERNVVYIVFEFGGRFYYNKPKQQRNKLGDTSFEADFNDFKYLGKNTTELEIPFVHLGVHSEYELLNGAHNSKLWVQKAKFLEHKAIGICDKDTLAGVLSFQLECSKKGIKPIIGQTISVALNYNPNIKVQVTSSLKLYVMNEEGWQNLLQINKAINVDYDKVIPEEILLSHKQTGLIAVIATNSHLNSTINHKVVEKLIKKYESKFEHLYWQIDTVEFYDDEMDMKHLNKIKRYLDNYSHLVEPVLINDSYYLDKEMAVLKEFMNKVDRKPQPHSIDQYYKNIDDVHNQFSLLFSDVDKYFSLLVRIAENTLKIANLCSFEVNVGEHKLPRYEFIEGMSNEDFLTERISDGFMKKIQNKYGDNIELLETYYERVKTEMKVIYDAGFVDYFLILWDVVVWAKENGIYVGTGRGSIGGCLLAYLLDIITIDPIEHDLLFERFMNAARISGERAKSADAMPDVDLDFESSNRDAVKEYIYNRFGTAHTCSIGSYTRLKLKAGMKDFARAEGIGFSDVNYITKDIDNQIEYTFKDLIKYALKSEPLYKFIQKNPKIVHCIKFSLGQARSASVHASAVMIVPKMNKNGDDVNIFNWLPIRKMGNMLVSEWEGKYCERAGFLKEDILSLLQLDKFKRIVELIKRNHDVDIVFEDIPLDDEKTYNLFRQGANEDVFQFGSMGLMSYSRNVKPDNIEELIAMNALYRPGPMSSEAHKDFALIKHGKKKPQYDYMLKEVTEDTYGLYVYQEQIMKAVVVLGGFSLVDADILRTQIKKFDKVAMHQSEQKFIQGAIKNGCPPTEALKIWNKLVAFSGYGFNKSHSAAYTLIGYWSQWLKANYPLEFWTASMNFAYHEQHIPRRMSEIKKINLFKGLTIKPPSINNSGVDFECDKVTQTIYWSLMKIKGLGTETVKGILKERKENGVFYSYEEFIKRVPKKNVNKASVAILILAGAFDEIENIVKPTERLDILKKHYKRLNEKLPEKYGRSILSKPYFWTIEQRRLTGYGEVDYKAILSANPKMNKITEQYMDGKKFHDNRKDFKKAIICGEVLKVIENKTKLGKPYMRIAMVCNDEELTMMIWSDTLEEGGGMDFFKFSKGKVIAVTGKVKWDTHYQNNLLYSHDETKYFEL